MVSPQHTLQTVIERHQAQSRRPSLLLLLTLMVIALTMTGCTLEPRGSGDAPKGPVTLYWNEPSNRVNGDLLAPLDSSGPGDIIAFDIRYRHKESRRFTRVIVDNSGADSYYFPSISDPENTIFQIAAIDKDGLYSNFVTAVR